MVGQPASLPEMNIPHVNTNPLMKQYAEILELRQLGEDNEQQLRLRLDISPWRVILSFTLA